MTASPERKGHLVALDSLRGICATIVVVHHFNVASHLYGSTIQRNGWMFVDFFFALSGFVIYYSYAHRLTEWRSCVPFMIKRFGRVWPLHVLILTILIAAEVAKSVTGYGAGGGHGAFGPQMEVGMILPNLLLIQALGFDQPSWNQPAWSISVEFWTYGIFAALAVLAGRRLIPVATGIVIVCAVLIGAVFEQHLDVSSNYGIVRCLYGFMLGTCVANAFRRGWLKPLAGTIAEVAVTLAAVAILFAGNSAWSVLATPVFALAIAVFANEGGVVSRALHARPIERLGLWSYSIYMIHVPLIIIGFNRVLTVLATRTGGGTMTADLPGGQTVTAVRFASLWMGDLALLIFVALVLTGAALSYRLVEAPWRDRFARLAATVAPGRRAAGGVRKDHV
ncbi:acyltransferase family protein [Sphingomonas paucimobilis]|uniref:acyltransferase family protein n=1 Tax=Sphingomonas paucimobilis TaxID=13689 RepID=UPI000DE4E49B